MVAYLSDEWTRALDAALASTPWPEPPPPEPSRDRPTDPPMDPIAVQYRVLGGPTGTRSWYLELRPGLLATRIGETSTPVVTFTQTWLVAVAIATGQRSASDAMLAGDVIVSGDTTKLVPWRGAMRRAGAVLADLTAATDFSLTDGSTPDTDSGAADSTNDLTSGTLSGA